MNDAGRQVARVREALGAQAAGWWTLDAGLLTLRAFDPGPTFPDNCVEPFTEAARVVPVDRVELGVARAAAGTSARSVAVELPNDVGSGYWLRRFGATHSVAVPVRAADGRVVAVVSMSFTAPSPTDHEIERTVQTLTNGF